MRKCNLQISYCDFLLHNPRGKEHAEVPERELKPGCHISSAFSRQGPVQACTLSLHPALGQTMGCSPPGSSVHWIFQARILEWVAISSAGNLPDPGSNPHLLHLLHCRQILYCSATAAAAKWLQSCLILCDPIDSSPPGSPVPGILQARTLEWAAIAFSRGSYQPRNQTGLSCIAGRCFTSWDFRELDRGNCN